MPAYIYPENMIGRVVLELFCVFMLFVNCLSEILGETTHKLLGFRFMSRIFLVQMPLIV